MLFNRIRVEGADVVLVVLKTMSFEDVFAPNKTEATQRLLASVLCTTIPKVVYHGTVYM